MKLLELNFLYFSASNLNIKHQLFCEVEQFFLYEKHWKIRLSRGKNCGCRALYNLPWIASVSSHQVQCNIPTFEASLQKMCTCFSKDADSLTMHGCMLSCSQIVYICPYSLNTIITFYSVTECPMLQFCSFEGMSSHNPCALYLTSTSLRISILLCSSVVPSITG